MRAFNWREYGSRTPKMLCLIVSIRGIIFNKFILLIDLVKYDQYNIKTFSP